MSPWLYYVLAGVLLLANGIAFSLNLLALPGNWLVLAFSGLFAWLVVSTSGAGIAWGTIMVLFVLALVAELLEFLAGMVGAAKGGASRRGMVLSVVGSVLGSITGAVIGLPVAFVGSAIAAVLGGAIGAAMGAAVGEAWKGRQLDEGLQIGSSAFWGRILGTTGKLVLGVIMVVVAAVDAFV